MNSGQDCEWDGTIPSMPQVAFLKYLMRWDILFTHEKMQVLFQRKINSKYLIGTVGHRAYYTAIVGFFLRQKQFYFLLCAFTFLEFNTMKTTSVKHVDKNTLSVSIIFYKIGFKENEKVHRKFRCILLNRNNCKKNSSKTQKSEEIQRIELEYETIFSNL